MPARPDDAPEVEWASRYELGMVLDRKYRLDELLGEGGMGAVWRARNLALDVDVAVKLMHGSVTDRETSARFEREAHAAARLEHPYAVRVFDLGQTELGDAFIVMELLRGENLRDIFEKRGAFAPAEIVTLLLPIASALAAAHEKGIVHRDLKPENIVLVAHDGAIVPKVVDFGIAKLDAGRPGHRTENGTILGSPEYMSPEQASGELDRVDARTDVWAFGVVLYEAIAGVPPFSASNALALLREVIEREPAPLPAGTEPEIAALIARAMAKDPDVRFPDMRAFGRALAGWAINRNIFVDASGGSIASTWMREGGSVEDIMDAAKITYGGGIAAQPEPRPGAGPARGIAIALGLVGIALGVGLLRGRLSSTAEGTPPRATPQEPAVIEPAEVTATPATGPSSVPAAGAGSAASSGATTASADAASSAAKAPAVEPGACMAARWPADSFEAGAALASLCAVSDPRRAAILLRTDIAKHGFIQHRTTEAMQTWSLLSWYELATVTAMRHACCPGDSPPETELPLPMGSCPALGPAVELLGAASRGGPPPPEALAKFRDVVACEVRGQRANGGNPGVYPYDGPPSNGAESTFVRWASRPR